MVIVIIVCMGAVYWAAGMLVALEILEAEERAEHRNRWEK